MSIKNAYYSFNTSSLPINPTGTDDEIFGVLVLELNQVIITKLPVFILFTVDATGSMSDYASHNTTKIQYAIQTLKSIVKHLSTQEIDIYVQINTFNDVVHTLIPPTKVSAQSLKEMLSLLQTIDADRCTNIETALNAATASITEYALVNPGHSCVHIFMTDGEPTSGATTTDKLIKCVSNEYLSINIGFGFDHNAKLLCGLSKHSNSEYHFIDKVEDASIVYGESLHKVLYPCLHNVCISIENGFIYDWLNHKWSTSIYENTLISEVKKYYHIKTSTPDIVDFIITASSECVAENNEVSTIHIEERICRLPDLINSSNENIIHDTNIIKFAFRQCVLEILYEAIHPEHNLGETVVIPIKHRIRDLFCKLRIYAEENQLLTDGFIRQLMNDLYLAYWNVGDMDGEIYIYGRYSSQGNQNAHTPGNSRIHNLIIGDGFDTPMRPVLRRYSNTRIQNRSLSIFTAFDSIDTDDDLSNGQTDSEYSCYSTPGIRNTSSSIRILDDLHN
jgi:uncharacterized protein YegL